MRYDGGVLKMPIQRGSYDDGGVVEMSIQKRWYDDGAMLELVPYYDDAGVLDTRCGCCY